MFHLYDTTLRDGSQQEGLTLSVEDKLQVARLLDDLGVSYIEGGWPGAVPKDTEFFARAQSDLTLKNARLAAFGATRKKDAVAKEDPQLRALVESGAPTLTLVAKSDLRHVEAALRTSAEENLAMVRESIEFLRECGREVFIDAEHFFDGYAYDADYAVSVVAEALRAGASIVVLCDTNGGMLPHKVSAIYADVRARLEAEGLDPDLLGAHMHNDSGCAIANTIAAVEAGAVHVQGCVNGYGERTGNADLIPVLANLQLKLGRKLVTDAQLGDATRIAHAIAEVANIPAQSRAPYVGASAFAHKAGLHASAIRVDPDLYQHMDPMVVGNDMRMIISDMAGKASIELKGRELGYDLSGEDATLALLAETVKGREAEGYSYEAADASFEMLVLHVLGDLPTYVEVESWRTSSHQLRDGSLESEATVRLSTAPHHRSVTIAEGNGPVNALDKALREALMDTYPQIASFALVDFKVRILDSQQGTDATTRVLVTSQAPFGRFTTVGVGPNIIEASWEALFDAYWYGLHKLGVTPARESGESY
ncbi:citramalate synthase [Dermabacter sp. Marseille-Q3180]|uniref:citramalate synthase n=1 Tax=Dermabacter sp. Marseille-Q3180 TaxID=2758090 RepID=UPI00202531A1|nr:citramalate synthase [Dermabacter sp. Marseille-Q3180]